MTNLIQIKRSSTASAPESLANGELAFTSNGDVLYIGSPNGSVVGIGGARFPGTLTANQALVANSTSGINEIRVGVANVGAVYANGGLGSNGQVLSSNGTAVFWGNVAATVSGSNTQIQFNDSGALAGDSDFTFNKDNNTLTIGTATVNSTNFSGTANNATNLGGVAASGYQTTAGLSANVATLTANNSTNLNGQPASFYTNATNLASGTVATARLGSGTANSTTFLGGDQSYKTAVTSVAAGNGLAGGPVTTTGTLSVAAGEGIISNSTGVFVQPGTGVTVNATGVHVGQAVGTTDTVTFGRLTITGNTALGDAITDIVSINGSVNTNIMPAANTTYGLGNTTMRWTQVHVANVHSNTGYFEGDVQIAGNLSVLGTTFTVSANNLIINDSLLQLAANNESSDLLDIGFFGSYNPDGGAHEHAGLFRDASDDVFKLFKGLQQSPNNVVNTSGTGYTIATLQAYLNSGGITTNATAVTITANASVNVAITANSLTLTTALAGTSGGTGRTTIANNAILVGNTVNGYNQLTLGASGHVLQSNGTALIYNSLDGGSF